MIARRIAFEPGVSCRRLECRWREPLEGRVPEEDDPVRGRVDEAKVSLFEVVVGKRSNSQLSSLPPCDV